MRKRFQVLTQKRADLVAQGKSVLDAADAAGRALTAEEIAADDALQNELKAIDLELEVYKRQHARETAMTVPAGARIAVGDPVIAGDRMGGFRDGAHFFTAVRAAGVPGGRIDPTLAAWRETSAKYLAAPANVHQEAGQAEGYMVPPEIREGIWELVFGEDPILGMIGPEPAMGNAVDILRDESTPWGATGIQASWRAENVQMTGSKLATGLDQVRLHELYAFVLASQELLDDAPRLNDRLTRKAALAIRWKINEAFMWGTGAGQPLGWMSSGALVTQTKEGGQAASTFTSANALKMLSRLWTGPGGRPVWFANRDTIPQLGVMALSGFPAWTIASADRGLVDNIPDRLLGFPLIFSEHCQSLTTKGDVQLVDLAGYYAATKAAGIQYATSIHLFFDYNVQAFRWIFRVGGQPFLSAPVAAAKGATTKSHFVCLENR